MTSASKIYLFGSNDTDTEQDFFWDTTSIPSVLDKKHLLVAVDQRYAKACSDVTHAFCNAVEVALSEIGECSQLDRIASDVEFPTLEEYIKWSDTTTVLGANLVKEINCVQRLNQQHLIDDLRVSLFCNIIPVIRFTTEPDFSDLPLSYEEQIQVLDRMTRNTDAYCAAVVGVNNDKQYIVCVSNRGYDFGNNSFFALSFSYLEKNFLEAFIVREVESLRSCIPEELYIRDRTVSETKPSGKWNKIRSFFGFK